MQTLIGGNVGQQGIQFFVVGAQRYTQAPAAPLALIQRIELHAQGLLALGRKRRELRGDRAQSDTLAFLQLQPGLVPRAAILTRGQR